MKQYNEAIKKTFIIFAAIISLFSFIGLLYCGATLAQSPDPVEVEACNNASTVLLILTLAPWSILSIISILMTKNND
jgi:hypothetical protein